MDRITDYLAFTRFLDISIFCKGTLILKLMEDSRAFDLVVLNVIFVLPIRGFLVRLRGLIRRVHRSFLYWRITFTLSIWLD